MIPAIAFLKGLSPDGKGRQIFEYVGFSAADWERCHDHMQWAFPTNTKSSFNPDAPVLPDDFEFDGDEEVIHNIHYLLGQYLASLGVEITHDDVMGYKVQWAPNEPRLRTWMQSRDHNMLRMTRVLECLGLFGMTDLQEALFDFLVFGIAVTHFRDINTRTVAFWVAAKENKLHLLR